MLVWLYNIPMFGEVDVTLMRMVPLKLHFLSRFQFVSLVHMRVYVGRLHDPNF